MDKAFKSETFLLSPQAYASCSQSACILNEWRSNDLFRVYTRIQLIHSYKIQHTSIQDTTLYIQHTTTYKPDFQIFQISRFPDFQIFRPDPRIQTGELRPDLPFVAAVEYRAAILRFRHKRHAIAHSTRVHCLSFPTLVWNVKKILLQYRCPRQFSNKHNTTQTQHKH